MGAQGRGWAVRHYSSTPHTVAEREEKTPGPTGTDTGCRLSGGQQNWPKLAALATFRNGSDRGHTAVCPLSHGAFCIEW